MEGMPISGTPSRAELVDHLIRTHIAGDVATPRENNLDHYRKLANGDRHYWLGLELGDRWTDEQDVLAVMAERCGVNDDPEHRFGQDTIDPELTVAGLERMAARLRKAAAGKERVLFATGHPGAARCAPGHRGGVAGRGVRHRRRPGRAVRRRGCRLPVRGRGDAGTGRDTVAHAFARADERGAGRAGAGGAGGARSCGRGPWVGGPCGPAGVDSVGFADCNDPALFLAEAEGRCRSRCRWTTTSVAPGSTTR